MSGYRQLPFEGGWRDQPSWIRQDFLTLLSLSRWHKFNEKLPKADGLPNAEDVA